MGRLEFSGEIGRAGTVANVVKDAYVYRCMRSTERVFNQCLYPLAAVSRTGQHRFMEN